MEEKKEIKSGSYIPEKAPDPTALTTPQLWREIASLKELVFARLDSIEKGIDVAHDDLVRVPTEVQKQISGLKELMYHKIECADELNEEKFKTIEKQFLFVEQSRIEQKKDTATAVDAALKAAKEAVTEQNTSNVLAISKSEASTTKQMDAINEKVGDVKERVTTMESKGTGKKDLWAVIVAVAIIVMAILNYMK